MGSGDPLSVLSGSPPCRWRQPGAYRVAESFAPSRPPATRTTAPTPPPSPAQRQTFGRPANVDSAFDPPPGSRRQARPEPESPWWKPDAPSDPWRDAGSPSRLGPPPDL